MVFASLTFLFLFLPAVLIVYYALRSQTARNVALTAFSLLFYAWGEPTWVALLLLTTLVDYTVGRWLEHVHGTRWARWVLAGSITSNLAILGVFKYGAFLVENFNQVLGTSLTVPGFSLPIGISFYTFQSMSYVIDVYRREVRAQRSYLRFLMFVSLFPQLVAGPIVRYAHIDQEVDERRTTRADFARGVQRLCLGLAKKVLIANVAGELVARYLDADLTALSVAEGWFGLAMFTLQIYFDFSGYSDMAIGMGLMFGFHFHENFDHPYIARSATDFWRRWHISLGTFFRDYVYIPLGGKEHHPYRNLFVVWLLTGLWHGASWNFVLWGLYFGLLIALERLVLRRVLQALPAVIGHAYLLAAVVIGWALFYFTDFSRLLVFMRLLFGQSDSPLVGTSLADVVRDHAFWLVAAIVACTPVRGLVGSWLAAHAVHSPARVTLGQAAVVVAQVGVVLLATAMLVGRSYNPFLYFRF